MIYNYYCRPTLVLGFNVFYEPDWRRSEHAVEICDCAVKDLERHGLPLMHTCSQIEWEMQDVPRRPNYIVTITEPRCYSCLWSEYQEFIFPPFLFRAEPTLMRIEFFPESRRIPYDDLCEHMYTDDVCDGRTCFLKGLGDPEARGNQSYPDCEYYQYSGCSLDHSAFQHPHSPRGIELPVLDDDTMITRSTATDLAAHGERLSHETHPVEYTDLIQRLCISFRDEYSCTGTNGSRPRLEIAVRKDLGAGLEAELWKYGVGVAYPAKHFVDHIEYV